jgi:hypothetical protein
MNDMTTIEEYANAQVTATMSFETYTKLAALLTIITGKVDRIDIQELVNDMTEDDKRQLQAIEFKRTR